MNLERIFGGAGTTAESVDTSAAGIQDWLMREVARELAVEISQLDPSVPSRTTAWTRSGPRPLSGTLGRHLGRNLSPGPLSGTTRRSWGPYRVTWLGEPVERAGAGGRVLGPRSRLIARGGRDATRRSDTERRRAMTTESTNTTSIAMRVRTLIAQHLDHDPAHVSQASRVVADLGADSLDLAEMVLILEDAFDATISESDLLDVVTVGDVTSLVERLVAAQVTDLVPGVAAPST